MKFVKSSVESLPDDDMDMFTRDSDKMFNYRWVLRAGIYHTLFVYQVFRICI